MKVQAVSLLLSSILLAGCQTGQHLNTPAAALTSATKTTAKVVTLPLPETPVDVAVYDFPDLTGQAKPMTALPSIAERLLKAADRSLSTC